ncbi:MAG: bifunctional transcriptional activator/DNA repair protein Ada [Planctomycetota bacterium]|nr:MAG: bifunctional transcriptional activator/DNA repair protein Ada [Planctomycetota bacterium]
MWKAVLSRDSAFDGIFFTAVKTTGIFCRPTCPARKPKPEHVEYFPDAKGALLAGYRPCKRCRPMAICGSPPPWLKPLLQAVEADPQKRWRDADLRSLGYSPSRIRRWFQSHHGMSFHAFSRARRMGTALGQIRLGKKVSSAAMDQDYESLSGFQEAFRKLLGTTPSRARSAPVLHVNRLATPLGLMLAAASDSALMLLEFCDRRALESQLRRLQRSWKGVLLPGENLLLEQSSDWLQAYFDGRKPAVPFALKPVGTPFQQRVWQALLDIPYGETCSYGQLAESLGKPAAVRAVGRANGANPIAILIPCHRVVGKDGRLTGYGGGLWRKKRLLELENPRPQAELQA